MGSTSETSYFQLTKNPRNPNVFRADLRRSAAAVAAGEVFLALGSDTGGSVRKPAAYCGVTGIKPTYGTVSRYGLIAYGSSLEQIGPLSKTVEDAVYLLEGIASYDPQDSTSVNRKEYDFSRFLTGGVKGMKIGIPSDYLREGPDDEICRSLLEAAKVLETKGAVIEEFNLGMLDYIVPAYYVIASAEAGSNLSRYDGVKYGYRTETYRDLHDMYKKTRSAGFGREVQRRLMLGSFVLSRGCYDKYYLKAQKVRELIKRTYQAAFEKYDVILGPVTPTTAPKIGKSLNDPVRMYFSDIYTVSANLTGIPAISFPCGVSKDGMPIGMQLMADSFREDLIIRAAYTFQQEVPLTSENSAI